MTSIGGEVVINWRGGGLNWRIGGGLNWRGSVVSIGGAVFSLGGAVLALGGAVVRAAVSLGVAADEPPDSNKMNGEHFQN